MSFTVVLSIFAAVAAVANGKPVPSDLEERVPQVCLSVAGLNLH